MPSPHIRRCLALLSASALCVSVPFAYGVYDSALRGAAASVAMPGASRAGVARVAPTLVRQPYLQRVGADSATVVWATIEPGPAEVRYRPNAGGPTLVAPAVTTLYTASRTGMASSYYQHEATLTGLASTSTYDYDVFVGGIDATPTTDALTTAPPVGTGTVSFVVFGDSGSGTSNQLRLAERIAADFASGHDFALHTGDIVYPKGTFQLFHDRFFAVYEEWLRRRPIFFALGNHEYYVEDAQPFLDLFAMPENGHDPQMPGYRERYYSFDYGPVHFVSLDTDAFSGNGPRQQQLTWLVRDLEATTQPWRIVFMHIPPYGSSDFASTFSIRTPLQPILQRYGVQLVLAGHQHAYARGGPWLDLPTVYTPVMHVVTGGGGASLNDATPGPWVARSARAYHYLRLQVSDCMPGSSCALTLEAIGLDGQRFDTFTLPLRAQHDDALPPEVDWIQPPAGGKVSGVTKVAATALDDQQVVKVDLWVDNELRFVDDTAPYQWSWNTADELNGNHTLELRALDIAGRVASSEVRSVQVSNSSPSVALHAPMYDRVFTGVPFRIRWLAASGAAPLAGFRVDVSSDGKTFRPLAGCEALPSTARECLWSVPGPASNRSAVRIIAVDTLGASVGRTSPPFKISSGTTTLSVQFPDKPTEIGIGSTQSIFWSTGLGLSPLTVELTLDGGLTWSTLASEWLPVNGDLRWTVSEPVTSQGRVRVRSMNTSLEDVSDAAFSIAPSSLRVSVPAAATVWRQNAQAQVKWTTNLGVYDRLNVRLSTDGGATYPIVLAGSVAAKTGVVRVIVPSVTTDAARVMLESLANPDWRAVGATFKIVPP